MICALVHDCAKAKILLSKLGASLGQIMNRGFWLFTPLFHTNYARDNWPFVSSSILNTKHDLCPSLLYLITELFSTQDIFMWYPYSSMYTTQRGPGGRGPLRIGRRRRDSNRLLHGMQVRMRSTGPVSILVARTRLEDQLLPQGRGRGREEAGGVDHGVEGGRVRVRGHHSQDCWAARQLG